MYVINVHLCTQVHMRVHSPLCAHTEARGWMLSYISTYSVFERWVFCCCVLVYFYYVLCVSVRWHKCGGQSTLLTNYLQEVGPS